MLLLCLSIAVKAQVTTSNCGDCRLYHKCQEATEGDDYVVYIQVTPESGNCPSSYSVSYEIECVDNGRQWWSAYSVTVYPGKETRERIGSTGSIYTGRARIKKIYCN